MIKALILTSPIFLFLFPKINNFKFFGFTFFLIFNYFLCFGTDLAGWDMYVYEKWQKHVCINPNFVLDEPLLGFLYRFFCFAGLSDGSVRIIIFLIGILQFIYIALLFKESHIALLIFLGLGNFYLANFNALSFNICLTIFLMVIFHRSVFARIFLIPMLILSHSVGIFLLFTLILSTFSRRFNLFVAVFSGLSAYLIIPLIFEERLANFFGGDISPINLFILGFLIFLTMVIKVEVDKNNLDLQDNQINNWTQTYLLIVTAIYLGTGIDIAIFLRILNPAFFGMIYLLICIINHRIEPKNIALPFVVIILIINLYTSVSADFNGWTLSDYRIFKTI